jgi:hypothetical protein
LSGRSPGRKGGPGGRNAASRPASADSSHSQVLSEAVRARPIPSKRDGREQVTPSARQSHLAVRREAFSFLVRWPRRNATEGDILSDASGAWGRSGTPLPREPTVRRPSGRRLRWTQLASRRDEGCHPRGGLGESPRSADADHEQAPPAALRPADGDVRGQGVPRPSRHIAAQLRVRMADRGRASRSSTLRVSSAARVGGRSCRPSPNPRPPA